MNGAQQRIRLALETLGAPAPWRVSTEQSGEIVDARGDPVLVVDCNRCVNDQVANRIGFYVALAVRMAAGASEK